MLAVYSSEDWNIDRALRRMHETQPCVVHVPGAQISRSVRSTLNALYSASAHATNHTH